MNNAVLRENGKFRYKLVTTGNRRDQLASEPNAIKYFSENLMASEMKKIKVKMNKPIYLGMSILDICKTYECMNFTLKQSTKTKQTMLNGYWQLWYSY